MAIIVKRLNYRGTSSSSSVAPRYLQSFTTSDWSSSAQDYVITILALTHGKGTSPTVTVYMDNAVTFEEVVVPITIDASGNVKIYVSLSPDNRFDGKLLII